MRDPNKTNGRRKLARNIAEILRIQDDAELQNTKRAQNLA